MALNIDDLLTEGYSISSCNTLHARSKTTVIAVLHAQVKPEKVAAKV
jgi:hypothetical protein